VCQVCLLDLEYGLPVQVRDSAMPNVEQIPLSDVNREYFADQAERRVEQGLVNYGKSLPDPTLIKLARVKPYYKRNRAHVCSFFVRGECNRGSECPYRHEKPEEGELSQQNIKDRYYGVNDPVAKKLLGRAEQFKTLTPPDDKEITTLYVGGLTPQITENDLRDHFYAYGEVRSIKIVPRAMCAFITYTGRDGAESAAENLYSKLVIKGTHIRISWGKPQQFEPGQFQMVDQQHASQPAGMGSASNNYFSLPPPPGPPPGIHYYPPVPRPYYPSMDPNLMGSKPEFDEKAKEEKSAVNEVE